MLKIDDMIYSPDALTTPSELRLMCLVEFNIGASLSASKTISLVSTNNKPYAGVVGYKIEIDSPIDLSDYDSLLLYYINPNNTTGYWSASLDTADNTKAYYITDNSSDLIAGKYKLNLKAEKNNGTITILDTTILKVYNIGEV